MVGSPQQVDCGVSNGQTIPSVVKSATGSIYQPPSCLIWDPAAPHSIWILSFTKAAPLLGLERKAKPYKCFSCFRYSVQKPEVLKTPVFL